VYRNLPALYTKHAIDKEKGKGTWRVKKEREQREGRGKGRGGGGGRERERESERKGLRCFKGILASLTVSLRVCYIKAFLGAILRRY
jgi:hypothetical protein